MLPCHNYNSKSLPKIKFPFSKVSHSNVPFICIALHPWANLRITRKVTLRKYKSYQWRRLWSYFPRPIRPCCKRHNWLLRRCQNCRVQSQEDCCCLPRGHRQYTMWCWAWGRHSSGKWSWRCRPCRGRCWSTLHSSEGLYEESMINNSYSTLQGTAIIHIMQILGHKQYHARAQETVC